MKHFRIHLPQGLDLLVAVDTTPIDLTFLFPAGGTAHFAVDPSNKKEDITISGLTHPSVGISSPGLIVLETVSEPGGPQIQYAAVGSDGTRPMEP